MKVTLIDFTGKGSRDERWAAANLLLFTKSTRLTMSPTLFDEIAAWPEEKKTAELAYMAETIPSSWEFVHYAFMIEGVSRAFTHQHVRTRTGSYAQQSLRVVERSTFDYVWPERALGPEQRDAISKHNAATATLYALLRETGVATEDARGILPTNIATNIVSGFNLRTLSELCRSRTGGRTQGEYIAVVQAMADAVLAVHPWAERFLFPAQRDYFADIEAFAEAEFGGDLLRKGRLLKIVDAMRKGAR